MLRRALLLALISLAAVAPPASAQPTKTVTIDFSSAGVGAFPRDFFNLQGVVFSRDGTVALVEGDEALLGSVSLSDEAIKATFNAPVTALAMHVAPRLRGLESFFTSVTSELTLLALDTRSDVVAQRTVTVTTNSQTGTGYGYVLIDLGALPRPATRFELTGKTVAAEASCSVPNCPSFFAASDMTYTIDVPASDTLGPVVTLPAEVKANATSESGARVSYPTRISDNADPHPQLSCQPSSGSLFPIGRTTVACTGRDASGNTTRTTGDVIVRPSPGDGVDYVSGFGIVSGQDFDVLAQAMPDGSNASGTLTLNGSIYRVTCLNVAGSRATVGGRVLSGNVSTEGLLVTVADNGDGPMPDVVVSFAFLEHPPPSCPAPGTGTALSIEGDVDVHDAPSDTTAPVLTVPASVTVNATGPGGATVTYTVSANDDVDPRPKVTCAAPSGSIFPIGTSTVTCTASDVAGNTSTKSFRVIVKGAADQLADEISVVRSFGLEHGIATSFTSKLDAARAALRASQRQAACDSLKAFSSHARAQSGKKLTVPQANRIIADARRIRAVIGCQ
jgi:hypothetical protein